VRTSAIVLGTALALAACGGGSADGGNDGPNGAIDGIEEERVGDYVHLVADVGYDTPAPSGGDHLPAPGWLNCGIYEGQVPDELAVHSLEHGAVWIALGPDSTDADRAAAVELADLRTGRVVVSDVPDLPSPVELVAWGVRLRLDTADDERAARFVEEYTDAATAPEGGALCESGFGEPPTPPDLPLE